MNDITEPLRLAVGSHSAGSGRGCAMNLISWENGDTTITDLPDCSDPMLARIVQRVNDKICTHTDDGLLCPPCSQVVLELGHRTVGTSGLSLSVRLNVYVHIAIDMAKSVQHLVPERLRDRSNRAIEAAQAWLDDPSSITLEELRNAAAAYAAAYAADAAANAADAAAAYAAAYAADAAAYAAVKGTEGALVSFARRAFDLFDELTAHEHVAVPDEEIARAYECMTASH